MCGLGDLVTYWHIACEIFNGLSALDVHMAWHQGLLLMVGTKYKLQFSVAKLIVELWSMFHFRPGGLKLGKMLVFFHYGLS